MEKNYEVLKHYLQSEKQAGNMKKRHRVPQMHRDEDQIVISYPNEEVCKERVVIRQNIKMFRFLITDMSISNFLL